MKSKCELDEQQIISEMLKDVRESVLFNNNEEILKKWKAAPCSRMNEYLKYKMIFSSDAERWPDAIGSYKKYGCLSFSEDDTPEEGKYYFYQKDRFIHYVKNDKSEVIIPADILTSVESIDILKKHYGYCNNTLLNAFYKVSYTIGAFCPVWKNPAAGVRKGPNNWYTGNSGRDCVWIKLKKLSDSKMCGLEKRENECNLQKRGEENLFSIFPEDNYKSDIIKKLYFLDYFNNGKLLRNIDSIYGVKKEELDDFIKELIVLIVKRSYRIITKYQENDLRPCDEKIISKALEDIGLKS